MNKCFRVRTMKNQRVAALYHSTICIAQFLFRIKLGSPTERESILLRNTV